MKNAMLTVMPVCNLLGVYLFIDDGDVHLKRYYKSRSFFESESIDA